MYSSTVFLFKVLWGIFHSHVFFFGGYPPAHFAKANSTTPCWPCPGPWNDGCLGFGESHVPQVSDCLIMFDHVARSMEEYQWCSSWQLGHGIVKRMSILEMTNLEVGAVGGPCARWWRLLRHSRVGPGDFVVVWCGSTPQTESKDRIYCKSVIGFKWFTVSWLLV